MHSASATRRVVLWARISSTGIPGASIPPARIMNRSSLAGGHDSAFVECSRFGSSSDWRFTAVLGSSQLRIRSGRLHMLPLIGYRRNVPLACRGLLFRPWTLTDAAVSTVVADASLVADINPRVVHV